MRAPESPQPVRPDTHAAALRATDSPVREILIRLMHLAPPPLDCAGLLAFCVGAAALVRLALGLLKQPTSELLQLRDQCQDLALACIKRFEAAGAADGYEPMADYKTLHSAWAAVVEVGSVDDVANHPAAAALAAELSVCLQKKKRLPLAFARDARLALADAEWKGVTLDEAITHKGEEKPPAWLGHGKKVLVEFRGAFEQAPPEPPSPKSFEERAASELRNRAAYASYRRRAGVLDTTCLSRTQLAECIAYGSPAPFANLAERKAAIWLVGMSGLFAGSVPDIPLSGSEPPHWVMHYDPNAGLLHRDYSCIAPEAARPRVGSFMPASFCAPTPAPEDVRSFTRERAASLGKPATVGDLIPALRQLLSHTALYPWAGDLEPSWARLARTLGPLGLQIGLDSMLVALITGDFGVTAKSKAHYCQISHAEIAAAAEKLYLALGLGKPVPMPEGLQLSFGASITTSIDELAALDAKWVATLNTLRPANRLSSPQALLIFHNRYVRVLGSRLCLWLSLRAAKRLPVRATIDPTVDLVVDLIEKTSAGRAGGMPAVICEAMRRDLEPYLAHCKSLRDRLRGFGWNGPVITWLDAVTEGDNVALLCEITPHRHARPLGTAEVMELEGASALAADWGRKAAENFLRRAGARWQDTDRHQRHEVKGQEQDTQLSEGTEAAWARRLAPFLDQLSRQVHLAPLYGLRNPAAQQ